MQHGFKNGAGDESRSGGSEIRGTAPVASDLLRAAGLRRTKARAAVLGLLRASRRPRSHQGILATPDAEGLDRVTLYRTLAALERGGLVHRVQGTDGAWRFCFHAPERPGCPGDHPHFLCRRCGRMTCLHGQTLPWVAVPEGTVVEGKQLVVHGLCAGCAGGVD